SLLSLLKREKPQIVHTHTAKAGALGRVAARIARIPRVHTFHGTVFDQYFGARMSQMIAVAERSLAKFTSRVVAVSHATADELEAVGIPNDKIRVIEPVIDLEPFHAVSERSGALRGGLGIPAESVVFAWAGRFVDIKDPLSFVEAAAAAAAFAP